MSAYDPKRISECLQETLASVFGDEVVKRSGVAKYGIYGAFGTKRELFIRAIKHAVGKISSKRIPPVGGACGQR